MSHTLIFDIGKTNKKAFLFDKDYQEVYKTYVQIEERQDEDGFPCGDLAAIQNWVRETIRAIFQSGKYEVNAINFSTYGASFVHVDKNGKPLTPIYNYLKPIPEGVLQSFYKKYGDELTIARETASPPLAMLNSGLQLYWLKETQPKLFKKIRWSLHLPQYLSYMLTGIPVSEYTSIGCHTALWDFSKKDYHHWVYQERIDALFPPIVPTSTSINITLENRRVKTGVGIHDSSAALLPYIRADKKPFLLVSTGTWSISINPINKQLLSDEDLNNDCLNFLSIDGNPVKAARLFLGQEYKEQVRQLQLYFQQSGNAHQTIRFDEAIFNKIIKNKKRLFALRYLKSPWKQPIESQLHNFDNFKEAYHQLVVELSDLQIESAKRALGETAIKKIYIDGGFADNKVYVAALKYYFENIKLRTTQSPLGAALGAAMVISNDQVNKEFLKKNYALKKV